MLHCTVAIHSTYLPTYAGTAYGTYLKGFGVPRWYVAESPGDSFRRLRRSIYFVEGFHAQISPRGFPMDRRVGYEFARYTIHYHWLALFTK
jgi:hypothetical protein